MITITIQAATQQEAREQFDAFFTAQAQASAAPTAPAAQPFPSTAPTYPSAPPAQPQYQPPQQTYQQPAYAPPQPQPPAAYQQPQQPQQPAPAAMPTATPAYTLEDLQRASSVVMDANKLPELQQLLASFQVQYIGELDPARYGDFAMGLKALGAKL